MVVLADRPLRQAVHAAVDPDPVPGVRVVLLRLVGVADVLGLGRGEVPGLDGGQSEQLPTQVTTITRHARPPQLQFQGLDTHETRDVM
jgi:hypothetical protein